VEAVAVAVPAPTVEVDYDGKNITVDLAPFLLSLTYTDNLDGEEADSLELELEDSDGRWLDAWYPDAGARLSARIGYAGQALVNCGTFEIDDISVRGAPATVSIKALSAGITKPMRTKRSAGYDATTLAEVARAVAARHNLTLMGEVEAIPIGRATQYRETDLAFLRRIAEEYGYAFNVRDTQLVFYRAKSLREAAPVLVIRPGDTSRFELRDKIKGTPAAASVAHHDPKTKAVVAYDVDADGHVSPTPSADSLRLKGRVENKAQAKAKAQAAVDRASVKGTTGQLTLPGEPRLLAGNNVELVGWGRFDGTYQISASRHTVSRSGGYASEIDIRRGKVAAAVQAKRAKAAQGGTAAARKPAAKRIAYDLDGTGRTVPVPAGSR
jgi:phage protein D